MSSRPFDPRYDVEVLNDEDPEQHWKAVIEDRDFNAWLEEYDPDWSGSIMTLHDAWVAGAARQDSACVEALLRTLEVLRRWASFDRRADMELERDTHRILEEFGVQLPGGRNLDSSKA
jgi:hypothetical protein